MVSTVRRWLDATDGEQAAPGEQQLFRLPAAIAHHHVAGAGSVV